MNTWIRSSACTYGNCVEVRHVDGHVEVRDSTAPDTVLCITPADWSTFLVGAKAGEFDGPAADTGRPATERLLAQLRREQAAIGAHHARKARRRLDWVWDLGHRKPWRSSVPVPWRHLPSLSQWVRNAHDCSDASLMCSCAGSPRFPRRSDPS